MIGSKLGELRRLRGLTQAEVAANLHCDRSYLSRNENNKVSPPLDLLQTLCEFLGAHHNRLADGEFSRHLLIESRLHYWGHVAIRLGIRFGQGPSSPRPPSIQPNELAGETHAPPIVAVTRFARLTWTACRQIRVTTPEPTAAGDRLKSSPWDSLLSY